MANTPNPTPDPNTLMDEREAAAILCYSVRALQNWRHRGGGPKFIRVSARSIRYLSVFRVFGTNGSVN